MNNIEYISERIKNIYETLNIYKSIFIVQHCIYDDIYKILLDDNYPVCKLNNFDKFINHLSRILLIKDIEIPKIYDYNISIHFKENVNLIIYINTPKINCIYTYKKYLHISNYIDMNIFEI